VFLDDHIFFLDDRALFFYHVWLYFSVADDGFGKDSRTQISGESLLNGNDVLLSPLPVPTCNLNELNQGKTTLINNAINNVDSIYNGDRDHLYSFFDIFHSTDVTSA
jgi:hypothetical protein